MTAVERLADFAVNAPYEEVSETARQLNMHRRTLQRILAKRAPK